MQFRKHFYLPELEKALTEESLDRMPFKCRYKQRPYGERYNDILGITRHLTVANMSTGASVNSIGFCE